MTSKNDYLTILDALLYRAEAEGWREMAFIIGMALILARQTAKARRANIPFARHAKRA